MYGVSGTIISIAMIALVGAMAHSEEAFYLVRDGESAYSIVIRDNAREPEQTAARELQSYLETATGATLPIVHESDARGESNIYVGHVNRFGELFPDIRLDELGSDGIILKTHENTLFLCGDEPRGTLYAVYEFLEEVVGCRWWTSTEEHVPERTRLAVPELDTIYTPPFRYRELWYRDTFDGLFGARLRLNGHHHPVPSEYGGHYSILGWCHTFYSLLPPDTYFEKHPEWYSEINGERTWQHAQLCLTNDEMRAELTRNALDWLRDNPDAGYISISQNDWYGRCECAECLAVEKKEGAPSGPLLHFVNAVAESIEEEFPEVLVETLAYQYTRQAPEHVRPRHNVLMRLCSIECSFAEPLTAEVNADFRQDIEAWSAISPQLFVWDYVANFSNYIQPHPNWFVLAPNVRFFADHNVTGLFEQGDGGSSCGDFVAMRAWVLAKLLWNPEQDTEALFNEFMSGYYGSAAEPLRRYMDVMYEAVRRDDTFLTCFMARTDDWLTLDDMNRATVWMDEAQDAVRGEPLLEERVLRARMPLDHVWLLRYYSLQREAELEDKPFRGPDDPIAACEVFIEDALRLDIGHYREGLPFADYAPQLQARFREPGPPPEACRDLDPADWRDVSDAEFTLFQPGHLAALVEDSAASDGMAAWMPGTHVEWAIQYPLGEDLAMMGPVRCRIVARSEGQGDVADALSMGIYDTTNQTNVVVKAISRDRSAGSEYVEFDLGVHDLETGMYFWVAPTGGGADVYVDRIYVMKDAS